MHRASALKKLNADSTAALIRYAIKNKLVEGSRGAERTGLTQRHF
jgi:hypothetical protein